MDIVQPDNPILGTLVFALDIARKEPDKWIWEPKADGWRSPLYKIDGKWIRQSKYITGPQAKKQPPIELMSELDRLNLPDETAFDAEWMGPRAAGHTGGRQWFVLYDLLYWKGRWMGGDPLIERQKSLASIINLHRTKSKFIAPNIMVVKGVTSGVKEFFEEQKKDPLSEGLVMKRLDSKLVRGGPNPAWFKIKYRG